MATWEPRVTQHVGLNAAQSKGRKNQSGYECEFVENPPKQIQADCPICLSVLCVPYQVTCCGYSFCKACIERVQVDRKACSVCNQENFTVYPNKGLERSLNEFKVRCSSKREGCEWVGELGALERHLNSNPVFGMELKGCQFLEIECLYCAKPFQRCHVEAHQNDSCPRRPFSCDYCRVYGTDYEDVVNKHWPVCPKFPLVCPNKCDRSYCIERQNLQQHLQQECPLTVVDCDLRYAGCEVRLPRKEMPVHLTEGLVTHMSLLAIHGGKLQKDLDEKSQTIDDLKQELIQLRSYAGVLPIQFTMTEFEQHKTENSMWYSPSFYTHPHGYKMRLAVYANGVAPYIDTHVSVFASLMHGEFDRHLPWPFQGHVTVQLLNQLDNKGHLTATFYFTEATEHCIHRVTVGNEATTSWGVDSFIPHTDLGHDHTKNCQYLKDDCLHFQVIQVTNISLLSEPESLVMESLSSTIPVQFTLPDFNQHKRTGDPWYSPPFYTHSQGYRMCLVVDARGYGEAKNGSVSVFLHLMRGFYDNKLNWPFRGDITVELLNQHEDPSNKESHSTTISYTENTPDCHAGQVDFGDKATAWGNCKFIAHSNLGLNPSKSCQYLKNDCLLFQVSKVTISNKQSKLWRRKQPPTATDALYIPFEITMTNFGRRKDSDSHWFSPSFYTHPQGYKFSLLVYANGIAEAHGTHISVFLQLQRGDYDSSLKWPFQGEFTIYLLNQLEGGGHRTRTVTYDDNTTTDVAGRDATLGWGTSTFVPHTALHYNPVTNCQYLKDNCLRFRVNLVKFLW